MKKRMHAGAAAALAAYAAFVAAWRSSCSVGVMRKPPHPEFGMCRAVPDMQIGSALLGCSGE